MENENTQSNKSKTFVTPERLILGAIGSILLSIIIDQHTALDTIRNTPAQLLEHVGSWHIFSLEVAGSLLREIGFAFAIAWAISMAIERVARQQEKQNAEALRQAIATDVFKAVIGSFVPEEIRDLALETILLAKVTRPSLTMNYVFKELLEDGTSNRKYLLLETSAEYTIRNESSQEIDFSVPVYIQKCPNQTLASRHALNTVAINHNALSGAEIEAGSSAVADTDGELRYSWPRKIPSHGTLDVLTRWSAVKELSDTEVWSSLMSSSHITLSVDMQVPNLTWGVDALHHGDMLQIGPKAKLGMNNYVSTKPVLPFQGFTVWWRPEEASKPPAMTVVQSSPRTA